MIPNMAGNVGLCGEGASSKLRLRIMRRRLPDASFLLDRAPHSGADSTSYLEPIISIWRSPPVAKMPGRTMVQHAWAVRHVDAQLLEKRV